ncbi:hypothetical protein [Burkholderia glumae]|uniref:hypothetical protein n=1 Tax=Burkholderia glumae TaxID=337 RepID=UPI00054AE58B|nr:hypothetical protein [Burkholderia glumae]KHJ63125.1 hypothetical protein NCPPB3923_09820 [Burkholderia glumae]
MSNVIDLSKYGRAPKRREFDTSVSYRLEGDRIICTAIFPVEKFEAVKAMIESQIAYWESPASGNAGRPP